MRWDEKELKIARWDNIIMYKWIKLKVERQKRNKLKRVKSGEKRKGSKKRMRGGVEVCRV